MFWGLKDDVFFFSKLPVDVWDEIFQFLNPLDIFCNAVDVCKNCRYNLLNFYLKNYLINNINFLNIERTDIFINELFKNEELFTKLKKYLFNQQVRSLSSQLQQKQIIIDKNYLFKESNIQRNLNELSNYFYLINHNKYIITEDNSENKMNNTHSSCFGSVFSFSNNNNNNEIHVNNNNSKKIIVIPNHYRNIFKGDTNNLTGFKSVLVGYSGVGKTCFVKASINKTFNDNKNTIAGTFALKQHTFEEFNLTFTMEIWDTAGPERHQSLTPLFYTFSKILFICFDLTNMESFKSVRKWKEEIEKNLRNALLYEVILLGFKSDLKERRSRKIGI